MNNNVRIVSEEDFQNLPAHEALSAPATISLEQAKNTKMFPNVHIQVNGGRIMNVSIYQGNINYTTEDGERESVKMEEFIEMLSAMGIVG